MVTWGDESSGGGSSSVQEQLKNVQRIQANPSAFAAIKGRRRRDYMGQRRLWGRQQLRAGPAEERAPGPSLPRDLCRHPKRWIGARVGPPVKSGPQAWAWVLKTLDVTFQ